MHVYRSDNALANGLQLHYLEWPGGAPAVLCLPGITANAHAFAGLLGKPAQTLAAISNFIVTGEHTP